MSYSFHHFAGWSDAEAAHNKSVGGAGEARFFDCGIASPGGAQKSSSDHKAKSPDPEVEVIPIEVTDDGGEQQFGTDTSTVLGAKHEAGVEAILECDTEAESFFLAEFVKKFKSVKRPATTTANERPSKKTRSATQNAGIYLQTDGSTVPEADPKPRACKKL